MRKKRRVFSERDDAYIRAHYRTMSHGDIARHLGWHVGSVRRRAVRIGVAKALKRWTDAEDSLIQAAWRDGKPMADVAQLLGRRVSEVSPRARMLGCRPWRRPKHMHGGRPTVGCREGRPYYDHRAVVERELGRRLRSCEIVHHIDGNKFNNAADNLHVFVGHSAHRKAHCTIELILPALLRGGIVKFDRTTGVYQLCETDK